MSVGLPLNFGDVAPKPDHEKMPKSGRSPKKEVALVKKAVGEEPSSKKGKIDRGVSVIKGYAKGRARAIEETVPFRSTKQSSRGCRIAANCKGL